MAVERQEALLAALHEPVPPARFFSARELALLAYADKLTLRPTAIGTNDIAALRAAGLDDLAIHDCCGIVAYYAFVNRIADGLGVELETPHQ